MATPKTSLPTQSFLSEEGNAWFNDLINSIRLDKILMEAGSAPKEKHSLYKNAIEGNHPEVFSQMNQLCIQYIVPNVINDYLNELIRKNILPKRLAFDFGSSSILVWAEIDDDNEMLEKQLILAEARVNMKNKKFGYHISSIIVEMGDNISIPSHYKQIAIKK